jgi:excisionase family DNA binding protein
MDDVAAPHELAGQETVVVREVAVFSKYLKTEEVAEILNVSTQAVQRWCNIGMLPASRFGRLFRVKVTDLQEFTREGERNGQKYAKDYNAGLAAQKQPAQSSSV